MIAIQRVIPGQAIELSNIAFAAKAHWGYPERWMAMWKPQLTFSADYFEQYESWAALSGDQPVAFYTLEERRRNGWLENLWVLPDYMGQGVGKELFLHAVELCRQRGYSILQLEADPHAVGFYEKMGMYKVGERQYAIDGQPRILPTMELHL
jgi:ribosomal protein S18 acetylase RimI-like enzyme